MIQDVMSTSVVLAEFGERFEGAYTILLSKNIVKTIQAYSISLLRLYRFLRSLITVYINFYALN